MTRRIVLALVVAVALLVATVSVALAAPGANSPWVEEDTCTHHGHPGVRMTHKVTDATKCFRVDVGF